MRAFDYLRAVAAAEAVTLVSGNPEAAFLAGGTTQLDLMKDGVLRPSALIDITRLPLRGVTRDADLLRVGAVTTMEELAADPVVRGRLPVIREALLLSASTQLRNMATIGGNLLQRTRCRYFRDPGVAACNKRSPGTGCAARTGVARMHAILGVSDDCIALHASDLAVALIALDATLLIQGPDRERTVPLTGFYLPPGDTPDRENVLAHGELITAVEIPLPHEDTRSAYLKVRERASYEFALTSAAAVVRLEGDGLIGEARVALGGVGTMPWRPVAAEEILHGARAGNEVFRDAAEAALQGAETVPGTAFKVELAKRTLVRVLQTVTGAGS